MTDMKVSSSQLFWMMISMQVVMTALLTTSPTAKIVQQDAWISLLLATAVGCSIAYMCVRLNALFPGETIFQYSKRITGRYVGNVISVLYLLFWIIVLAMIMSQFSFFIAGTILPETPMFVISILMALAVIYPTLHGVGVIARLSEVMGPIVLVGIVLPALLNVNHMDWEKLLPIYRDNGMIPILSGAVPAAVFLGDCAMLLVLIAFVEKKKKIALYAVSGVLMSGLFTLLSVIVCLITFGPEVTSSTAYPLLILVRSISIGGIIENLDAIIIAIWIMSVFIKLCLYSFVSGYGTSELFGIKDWRKTVWWISGAATLLSFIPRNYVEASVIFPKYVATPILFPICLLFLPLLLLLIAIIRKKHTTAK